METGTSLGLAAQPDSRAVFSTFLSLWPFNTVPRGGDSNQKITFVATSYLECCYCYKYLISLMVLGNPWEGVIQPQRSCDPQFENRCSRCSASSKAVRDPFSKEVIMFLRMAPKVVLWFTHVRAYTYTHTHTVVKMVQWVKLTATKPERLNSVLGAHPQVSSDLHTFSVACVCHPQTPVCSNTHMHTHIHTYMHTCMHTCIHAQS